MIFNAFGDLILDSQADAGLIVVHHPGFEDQSVYHLPITQNRSPVQLDDTVLATAGHGVILASDRDGETRLRDRAKHFLARRILQRDNHFGGGSGSGDRRPH